MSYARPILCLLLCLAIIGCGRSYVPVTGKVTYENAPVVGGTVVFTSEDGGLPASATVGEDGTYVLKSNDAAGVQTGKYVMIYVPPKVETTEEQRKDKTFVVPPSPYLGLKVKIDKIEITPSTKTIDIELVPGPRP